MLSIKICGVSKAVLGLHPAPGQAVCRLGALAWWDSKKENRRRPRVWVQGWMLGLRAGRNAHGLLMHAGGQKRQE